MNGNQLGGMLCRLCSSEQEDFVKFDKELEQNSFGLFGEVKKVWLNEMNLGFNRLHSEWH